MLDVIRIDQLQVFILTSGELIVIHNTPDQWSTWVPVKVSFTSLLSSSYFIAYIKPQTFVVIARLLELLFLNIKLK